MIAKSTKLYNIDISNRVTVRTAYNTTEGRAELLRLLIDHGIFREIDVKELEMRNYGIRKLEELGFLDEEILSDLINWLFNQPIVQRKTVEEIKTLKGE